MPITSILRRGRNKLKLLQKTLIGLLPALVGIGAVIWACIVPASARAADEPAQIRALISHEFDRPGAKVATDPIVIEQEFALADWMQGKKGGRALLHNQHGRWTILLCSGDGVKKTAYLVSAGVPPQVAETLLNKLAGMEGNLPPAQVEMFGRFGAEQRKHSDHH